MIKYLFDKPLLSSIAVAIYYGLFFTFILWVAGRKNLFRKWIIIMFGIFLISSIIGNIPFIGIKTSLFLGYLVAMLLMSYLTFVCFLVGILYLVPFIFFEEPPLQILSLHKKIGFNILIFAVIWGGLCFIFLPEFQFNVGGYYGPSYGLSLLAFGLLIFITIQIIRKRKLLKNEYKNNYFIIRDLKYLYIFSIIGALAYLTLSIINSLTGKDASFNIFYFINFIAFGTLFLLSIGIGYELSKGRNKIVASLSGAFGGIVGGILPFGLIFLIKGLMGNDITNWGIYLPNQVLKGGLLGFGIVGINQLFDKTKKIWTIILSVSGGILAAGFYYKIVMWYIHRFPHPLGLIPRRMIIDLIIEGGIVGIGVGIGILIIRSRNSICKREDPNVV